MARLYLLLFVAQIVLAAIALIGCLSAEEGEIRALPRIAWVLIILFFPLLGSIAWFVAGRPVAAAGKPGAWRVGGAFPEHQRPRPLAPDDDPEFLRSVDAQRSTQDRELFDRWEEDLRRREEELRRRDTDDPPQEERRPDASDA
ncbi:Phospholipase_D-nuclease N-terminal [Micromonospora pattaloongensis]|uniref:Phospholipase_D-nuclease N-terminal n=1 Tax=Micromonospora pattaloongensis TaxID=405436 RepID=A0A1H3FH21_9ACTN|nr:PLD nuclease N-terminal domain-containing protein [Micromonospora pattaloongensis]SDX90266.1 Phospholipase_D-nuclease N-terminal [Micromonospora pattaloongensis]